MAILDRMKALIGTREATQVDRPTASAYIDWLPRYMLKKSITELRIDTARPLPGADEAPGSPEIPEVINRIKVLCGLNPFLLSEPAEGRFEKEHSGHRLRYAVSFTDRSDRSICVLKLSIRA